MVKALEQEKESYRSKLFHFRGMFDNTSKHTKSLSVESASTLDPSPLEEEPVSSRSVGSKPLNELADNVPKPKVCTKEEIAAKEAKEKLLQGKH